MTGRAPDESSGASSFQEEAGLHLVLWPHRSLTPWGFVIFIGATAAMLALPMMALIGTAAVWGILPFAAVSLGGVWLALRSNGRGGELHEELWLSHDRIAVTRRAPGEDEQHWEANPYWVRIKLSAEGGPIENYLTLEGGGRTIELGAFLSPEERAALYRTLNAEISAKAGRG